MTNSDKQTNKKGNIKLLIAFLAGVALVYFIVTFVVDQRLSELQLQTKLLISDQETLIATIAETTARNGGDEVTERIIRDCALSERVRFDELLGNLNRNLSMSELVELERLFGRCGNFFAERKSVMVARLDREVQIYAAFVSQLSNLTDKETASKYRVADWQQLAELEKKQSELFTELVGVQDDIISALLDGNAADSEEVTAIVQRANEIQETLIVTNTQASQVRSSLVSL